jgi:hypothetical protein
MIIGVFGPGSVDRQPYENYKYIASSLNQFDGVTKIITGGGKGVESLALRYAVERDITPEVVPPSIQKFGAKLAFKKRNEIIIKLCDLIIVFWNGEKQVFLDIFTETVKEQKKKLMILPLE